MKKAFSTVACQELCYREVIESALDQGIHAIEVRLHKGNKFFDLPMEEIIWAKEYFATKQIVITNLGTGIALLDYEPDKILAAKSAVELAFLVGARGIRLFLGQFKSRFSEEAKMNYVGIIESVKIGRASCRERV